MSHYTVAVITHTGEYDEIASLLAPYDENLEVESYIHRTREQIIEDGKTNKERWIERIKEEDTVDRLREYLLSPAYQWTRKLLAAETDEDFYEAEADPDMVHADGNEYTTYNPDSKWDWYQIGGRWSDSLRDKFGEYDDTLQIKDWDYNYIDPDDVKYYSRFWDVVVEGMPETEEEKENHTFFTFKNDKYYREKYGNKSEYIKSMLTFSTYAVLTPDGEWLAPGEMGWWGCSLADPATEGSWERNFTSLIDTADPEDYITIVDCHIQKGLLMQMWWDDDICWCADSERCTNYECFRHLDNMKDKTYPCIFTCSNLMGTEICPLTNEGEN